MNLFVFFALPLATILLAIVLQNILKSPILVSITFFAIYLIGAFTAFIDTLADALILTVIYTIIAYITANIVMIICRLRNRFCRCQSRDENESQRRCSCSNNNEDNNNNTENNLLRISCSCGNSDRSSDLLTVDSTCMGDSKENENFETEPFANENIQTNNQYVNRISNYGNRRCLRRV